MCLGARRYSYLGLMKNIYDAVPLPFFHRLLYLRYGFWGCGVVGARRPQPLASNLGTNNAVPPLLPPITSDLNKKIICGIKGEASAKDIFCHNHNLWALLLRPYEPGFSPAGVFWPFSYIPSPRMILNSTLPPLGVGQIPHLSPYATVSPTGYKSNLAFSVLN